MAGELPVGDGEIGRLCLWRRECLFSWSDREVVGLEGERSPSGDSSGAELLTLSERWAWRWSNSVVEKPFVWYLFPEDCTSLRTGGEQRLEVGGVLPKTFQLIGLARRGVPLLAFYILYPILKSTECVSSAFVLLATLPSRPSRTLSSFSAVFCWHWRYQLESQRTASCARFK